MEVMESDPEHGMGGRLESLEKESAPSQPLVPQRRSTRRRDEKKEEKGEEKEPSGIMMGGPTRRGGHHLPSVVQQQQPQPSLPPSSYPSNHGKRGKDRMDGYYEQEGGGGSGRWVDGMARGGGREEEEETKKEMGSGHHGRRTSFMEGNHEKIKIGMDVDMEDPEDLDPSEEEEQRGKDPHNQKEDDDDDDDENEEEMEEEEGRNKKERRQGARDGGLHRKRECDEEETHVDEKEEYSSDEVGEGDEDFERRRREALEHMARIEKEFGELKDRLFQEKMAGLKKEMDQVLNNEHPEYLEQITQLDKKKNEKLRMADYWRAYQLECLNTRYNAEIEQADTEFLHDKTGLREKLVTRLQEQKRKLEDEKNTLDLSAEIAFDLQARQAVTRKLRKRGMDHVDLKVAKKKIATGPLIMHQLKDADALEDLYIIRKALNPSATRRTLAASLAATDGQKRPTILFDNGTLYCDQQRFDRGQLVVVDSKDAGKFAGTITAINAQELWVRKTDGTKVKVYLSHLRSGKLVLKVKNS